MSSKLLRIAIFKSYIKKIMEDGATYRQVLEIVNRILALKHRCTKILISGLPLHVRFDNIEHLLSQYGSVVRYDTVFSPDSSSQSAHVMYTTTDQAQLAVKGLNGYELEGSRLKVELAENPAHDGCRARPGGDSRPTELPLRLMVRNFMVNAIMGSQGSTLREITQQTRARIDIHRKENIGSLEKAVTIYGNPKSCTDACKRILEVVQQEAAKTNRGNVLLKILVPNNFIGRIIGKGGNTIKTIMQETDTKIMVSPINDVNGSHLERIVTVKGSIENMSKAESQISAKLRQCYENDLERTVYVYIPNSAVGALIGSKGFNIRNINRYSNADVRIAPLEQDNENQPDITKGRKITIIGNPEARWKAQYLIFEQLYQEGFTCGNDDVKLTVEIMVAPTHVGRIIGMGGQNVRELQRLTGARIMLPGQPCQLSEQPYYGTSVYILGTFRSVQLAQYCIRLACNAKGTFYGGYDPEPPTAQQ